MTPSPTLCRHCVLPSTFPGIAFDDEGVCQHCHRARGYERKPEEMAACESKFLNLVESSRGRGTYDVIMAYSGGKDSSYTLEVFVKRYGLRVLAMTFDNAFMSPRSFDNVAAVCSSLGVDSVVVRPDPGMLMTIFKAAASQELYSPKTLERASTICTSCIGMVKGMVLRTAVEKAIPFVGFGWSPGQAPIQSAVMRTNAALMKATTRAVHEPLRRVAGDRVDPYFLTEEQFGTPDRFPWNIHPLAFLEYDEASIVERIGGLGWKKPDDTDPNSTNCLLNAYANKIHLGRYGFHPYAWEIANMVRQGVMSRQEGIEKLENPAEMARYAEEILG